MTPEERERIINEINSLPSGGITYKTISGKKYAYYQWSENGKQKNRRIKDEEIDELTEKIARRKELQAELKANASFQEIDSTQYHATVRIGFALNNYIAPVKKLKKRSCISELREYVFCDMSDKVFILYGLRRTGKTTMIRQIISEMDSSMLEKTAFIQVSRRDNLASINKDLSKLESNGIKYVFLDEVTLMEDFIEGAALFSDVYASSGMKIVLSGTDSLGFVFTEDEQLYDRCIMLHTTLIPYREFADVLGIEGIDVYIKYGGTMSISGKNYNEKSPFASKVKSDEYFNTSIARNIQHSLKHYQNGAHFRNLYDLYNENELTSAINRIVEDINHRFTVETLTRDFKSSDLSLSAKNLRSDRNRPDNILDNIDVKEVTKRLVKLLEIKSKEEQNVKIQPVHAKEIKEYLDLLDLTVDVDVRNMSDESSQSHHTIITQPGLRYAQVDALINSLLFDSTFSDLSIDRRNYVLSRIRSEIMGRMMEDIVILETKVSNPKKEVFKLQFAVGEFDMVVFDRANACCELYEIKHSTERNEKQYRHLLDEKKCSDTEFRYGRITGKYVIYRGNDYTEGDIQYLNVEQYLIKLLQQ